MSVPTFLVFFGLGVSLTISGSILTYHEKSGQDHNVSGKGMLSAGVILLFLFIFASEMTPSKHGGDVTRNITDGTLGIGSFIMIVIGSIAIAENSDREFGITLVVLGVIMMTLIVMRHGPVLYYKIKSGLTSYKHRRLIERNDKARLRAAERAADRRSSMARRPSKRRISTRRRPPTVPARKSRRPPTIPARKSRRPPTLPARPKGIIESIRESIGLGKKGPTKSMLKAEEEMLARIREGLGTFAGEDNNIEYVDEDEDEGYNKYFEDASPGFLDKFNEIIGDDDDESVRSSVQSKRSSARSRVPSERTPHHLPSEYNVGRGVDLRDLYNHPLARVNENDFQRDSYKNKSLRTRKGLGSYKPLTKLQELALKKKKK